jgi:dimethylhistidine N-methyltransferase
VVQGSPIGSRGAARADLEAPATPADSSFARDVRDGLTASPKSLPCVYFYDARGSLLFERITLLPEYYLTRAETEIIRERAGEIAAEASGRIQVVEMGSGTSTKTVTLLEELLGTADRVTYLPVDVCGDVLEKSAATLRETLPHLTVEPIEARYREGLERVAGEGEVLLLWLGSSIGNLARDKAASYLRCFRERLSPGDRMLIGIDLAKDPEVLEAAYNDSAGVTAEFNLNLLRRINRELKGDFDLERFRHVACWNPDEGRIEMYLESPGPQSVSIAALDLTVEFGSCERVHTESSYKYTHGEIEALAGRAGLVLQHVWVDSRGLFSLCSLRVGGPAAAP